MIRKAQNVIYFFETYEEGTRIKVNVKNDIDLDINTQLIGYPIIDNKD